ncbi:MAG: alpha/beta hydrolase [Thermoleophilia bacterium]
MSAVDGWTYLSDPGRAAAGPALLMLHGTGGTEHEMLAFGRSLLPDAPVLAPRGRVSEGGAARFFSRTPQDPFRFPDLAERIDELASFVREASAAHGLDGRPLVAVGYSNGANAAADLMLRHPGLLAGGALLRPMLPEPAPAGLDLTGTRVLLLGGQADTMIPPDRVEALAGALRTAGAEVQEHWAPTGHGLTQGDLDATAAFVRAF